MGREKLAYHQLSYPPLPKYLSSNSFILIKFLFSTYITVGNMKRLSYLDNFKQCRKFFSTLFRHLPFLCLANNSSQFA